MTHDEYAAATYERFRAQVDEYVALRASLDFVRSAIKYRASIIENYRAFFRAQGIVEPTLPPRSGDGA